MRQVLVIGFLSLSVQAFPLTHAHAHQVHQINPKTIVATQLTISLPQWIVHAQLGQWQQPQTLTLQKVRLTNPTSQLTTQQLTVNLSQQTATSHTKLTGHYQHNPISAPAFCLKNQTLVFPQGVTLRHPLPAQTETDTIAKNSSHHLS